MLLEAPSQRTEHVDRHGYLCSFLWLMNYASYSAHHFCACSEGPSRPEAANRDHTMPLAHHESSMHSCMHPALAHTQMPRRKETRRQNLRGALEHPPVQVGAVQTHHRNMFNPRELPAAHTAECTRAHPYRYKDIHITSLPESQISSPHQLTSRSQI